MPYLSTNAPPTSTNGQLVVHQHTMPSSSAAEARRQASRENSVFAAFNRHANACAQCNKPLDVVKRGDQLCDEGHRIAQDVATTLYQMAGARNESYENYKGPYVKMLLNLTDFDGPVYDLVKAMDRGLQNRMASSPQPRQPVHYYNPSMPSPASSSRSLQSSESAVPRKSGSIRINVAVPSSGIEYGKEAHEYEEFTHSNGGRVTTKYYHAETRQLTRRNSIGDAPRGSGKRKGVHFDDEVRCVEYYP